MKPSDKRVLAGIQAELSRVIRYDDESIMNGKWIRQRYDCGCYPSLAPARKATVETAWHKASHAVAPLAVGARFSSASIATATVTRAGSMVSGELPIWRSSSTRLARSQNG